MTGTNPRYPVGSVVRYWQPGVDAILASWSGQRGRASDGKLVEVTITRVLSDEGGTFYETDKGVLLSDADIRAVVQ